MNVVVKVMFRSVVGMIEFKVFLGFYFKTDGRTDICNCRVAFATEIAV